MSTVLRTSARTPVAVSRDPEVTALVNARRNRTVRSAETETPKAKARRSAAERGATSRNGDVPENDPVIKTTKAMSKAGKEAKAVKAKAGKGKAKVERTARPKLEAYGVRKDGSLSARGLTCLCGCGQPTVTADARFLSGHDAKMRQTILSADDQAAAIPEIVRPMFEARETIAGLRLSKSGKVVDVKASKVEEATEEE